MAHIHLENGRLEEFRFDGTTWATTIPVRDMNPSSDSMKRQSAGRNGNSSRHVVIVSGFLKPCYLRMDG
ncbi:MAG TPA: hypothetical protein PLO63_10350 [Syntrophales bacterium]|nr:hypothetical protein [Syntrophales bacterium]